MIMINEDTDEHLDMVGTDVIQRLLADKWKVYARRKFMERFGMLMLHLFAMCFAVYTRPESAEELLIANAKKDGRVQGITRTVAEAITIIGCLAFVVIQQGGEIRSEGFRGSMRNLVSPQKHSTYYLLRSKCIVT